MPTRSGRVMARPSRHQLTEHMEECKQSIPRFSLEAWDIYSPVGFRLFSSIHPAADPPKSNKWFLIPLRGELATGVLRDGGCRNPLRSSGDL